MYLKLLKFKLYKIMPTHLTYNYVLYVPRILVFINNFKDSNTVLNVICITSEKCNATNVLLALF